MRVNMLAGFYCGAGASHDLSIPHNVLTGGD
jgi:hypothetical protein